MIGTYHSLIIDNNKFIQHNISKRASVIAEKLLCLPFLDYGWFEFGT